MTEFEKQIYNTHLATSRKAKGQAYKTRKDFSDLEEEKDLQLQKLSKFFSAYPNIVMDDFFYAPHKIYPDDQYYGLDFYTSPKALKCYTQYMKMLDTQDPDTSDSLLRLQSSLKFVRDFCLEKGISISEYEKYTTDILPHFIDHLKSHKINFYTLHALTFSLPKIESRILDFAFSDFYGTFRTTRNKFYASKKMKEFSKQAKLKLESITNGQ